MNARIGYWMREVFVEEGPLLAVSLILAVLLWLYVNDELSAERDIVVPVRIALPELMALEPGSQPPEVRVRVRGPKRKVELLGPSEVRCTCEVEPGVPPGPRTLHLTPANFTAPPEVAVTEVAEADVAVILVQTIHTLMQVKVATQGAPREGYTLDGPPVALPNKVTVTGPSNLLTDVQAIETIPVDLAGQSSTFTRRVALAQSVRVGKSQVPVEAPETVEVTVRLKEESVPRVFPGVWVRALVPAEMIVQVTIKPPQLAVKVQGEKGRVSTLRQEEILLYVDLSNDTREGPHEATLPVQAVPIRGVSITGEAGILPPVSVKWTFNEAGKEPAKQ